MFKFCMSRIFLVLVLMPVTMFAIAETKVNKEYQLKAAYMLNFARFIYWPEEAFKVSSGKFNICVYGESPFGESLDKLSTKKIKNKNINLKYTNFPEELNECHIVYVSISKESIYEEEFQAMPRMYMLTVSDIKDFSVKGGMIEFIRLEKRIKFNINVNKSHEAGIKYRSQLLEVAEHLR